MEEKRNRKKNFSHEEILILIDGYKENKTVLESKLNSSVTNRKKGEIWQDITNKINAKGCEQREIKEVRKKWSDLKTQAIEDFPRTKHVPTGGGPRPEPSPYSTVILEILATTHPPSVESLELKVEVKPQTTLLKVFIVSYYFILIMFSKNTYCASHMSKCKSHGTGEKKNQYFLTRSCERKKSTFVLLFLLLLFLLLLYTSLKQSELGHNSVKLQKQVLVYSSAGLASSQPTCDSQLATETCGDNTVAPASAGDLSVLRTDRPESTQDKELLVENTKKRKRPNEQDEDINFSRCKLIKLECAKVEEEILKIKSERKKIELENVKLNLEIIKLQEELKPLGYSFNIIEM